MAYINIMVGIPYSGKSTWVKNNRQENEYVISADRIRLQVYGQEYFKGGEPIIWSVRHYMLINTLEQNFNLIIDETNLTVSRRYRIIELANKYNYKVNAICMLTDFETCKKRFDTEYYSITNEDKKLLKLEKFSEMEKMQRYKKEPSKDEGFNNIIYIEN